MTLPALLAAATARVVVIDTETGETIAGVIEADPATGRIRRFEIEDGNFVRRGDSFVVIEEERPHRLEAPDDPAADEGDAA